jgi:hypothetical protein
MVMHLEGKEDGAAAPPVTATAPLTFPPIGAKLEPTQRLSNALPEDETPR